MINLKKKAGRPIFFICAAISNTGDLITKSIQAVSQEEAASVFFKNTNVSAKDILGPFLKKRTKIVENSRVLKFSEHNKKAIYDNWEVNAFLLKEPENHAYLVFIKRIDNINKIIPKGTTIVPISDLRIIDE